MNMNSLETIIAKKLKEAEPALDIHGSDRKVLQVACQDFTNYLKFNTTQGGKSKNDYSVAEKIDQFLAKEPAEFESFLTVWTGMWLKKWKQRIKLLFGDQNQKKLSNISKTLADASELWTKLECKQEMLEIVVSALIRNAEICGTEILAENILKTELGKNHTCDTADKEQTLVILNNALRRAREMTQGTGPLIYVKIDKRYYSQ
jgi:hypothetical protein